VADDPSEYLQGMQFIESADGHQLVAVDV